MTGIALTGEQSPALRALVRAIREALSVSDERAGRTPLAVAELLPAFLAEPELLTPAQRMPDPTNYCQHLLHVEEGGAFSIVSLVWLSGQETPIHDHIAWCCVGVYKGREHETRYRVHRSPDGGAYELHEEGCAVNVTGSALAMLPGGDVHRVCNAGPDVAISIHVYGADIGKLGSSIYRRYKFTGSESDRSAVDELHRGS